MLSALKLSPFSNVKVLDFSRILAAPLASMILTDLGAEVWKIEKIESGDETRQWNNPSVNGQSCYFLSVNRNKKSVAINLANREGVELARRLSLKADIVLENFKVGQMEKFGLHYEKLASENPRLIYCSLTGYGSTGPYAKDPGYDVIAEAVGGLIGITGPKAPDYLPCKAGVALIDALAGLYAYGAIVTALFQRKTTGSGQLIECNLMSTQIASLFNIGSNFLNSAMEGRPLGTEHESLVPYQAFRCRDNRYYVVGATSDDAFHELCVLLGLSELSDSRQFKTLSARVKNREQLIEILSKRFAMETLDYWNNCLRSNKFPSGPVNSISEAFSHPQVEYLGLVQELCHHYYGSVKVVGPPVSYSVAENRVRSAPPLLGEHTKEVLHKELLLSEYELQKLKENKIIYF